MLSVRVQTFIWEVVDIFPWSSHSTELSQNKSLNLPPGAIVAQCRPLKSIPPSFSEYKYFTMPHEATGLLCLWPIGWRHICFLLCGLTWNWKAEFFLRSCKLRWPISARFIWNPYGSIPLYWIKILTTTFFIIFLKWPLKVKGSEYCWKWLESIDNC